MLRTFTARESWPAELDEAVAFATRWHGDQRRPAGEPYVEHLLEALAVLMDGVGVTDLDVLRAAVLHDVVEDTDCTLDEVRARFGSRTAELVDWVTKDADREAYLLRLRDAPTDALMVKLADRLSNVQRLDTHPREAKQRTYYAETVRSIVPLAQAHPWFREWYATWQHTFARLA